MNSIIYCLVCFSGFATISWEVIWQLKSSLALGISSFGTALTLAVIMGGMSIGSYLMGRFIMHREYINPFVTYAVLEFIIGAFGLLVTALFLLVEKLDTLTFVLVPQSVAFMQIIGITAVLIVPAIAMGGTIPVFGIIAENKKISLAKLYGLNTLGAAAGVLCVALILIPQLSVNATIFIIAMMNFFVCIFAMLIPGIFTHKSSGKLVEQSPNKDLFIVFITGFATFSLEVAWCRSLASTFPNTTDVFAIMLASLLIALGFAAIKKPKKISSSLYLAGILILLITPLLERFDLMFVPSHHGSTTNFNVVDLGVKHYLLQLGVFFFLSSLFLIPPMFYLGRIFPSLLNQSSSPTYKATLYALNTLAAMIGSILTAWVLLPEVGFAKSCWLSGSLVLLAAVILKPRVLYILSGIGAILFAIHFESGIGVKRVQGPFANLEGPSKVLKSFETPDATISAVEYKNHERALLINSSIAAGQSQTKPGTHYLAWMGHLPMLLHPNPKKTLVICFGTGQTANAVLQENPESLDVVDINAKVFTLAHYFHSNQNVLANPKVTSFIMDGRAYLRRVPKQYDVITLEPMPPVTVGVNALYTKEFYQLARKRLSKEGVIAQWLPFHLLAPHYAASVARTFIDVFPNAILWIDPISRNGILLGSKTKNFNDWRGFTRVKIQRDLTLNEVKNSIALDADELKQFSQYGEIINDNNQLLSYGKVLFAYGGLQQANFDLMTKAKILRGNRL